MSKQVNIRELNVGTMKSAKSAQLIMKGYLLDEQGKRVLTFKPKGDTRDGNFVTSRALKVQRPALVIDYENGEKIISYMVEKYRPEVILIDELQFFSTKQIELFASLSVLYNVDIYAYGLMMSYNGKMFEPIIRAIECAFTLKNIEMSCEKCINNATHHLLYLDNILQVEGDSINVEDFNNKKQRYESVCFECYRRTLDEKEYEIEYLKQYPQEVFNTDKKNK